MRERSRMYGVILATVKNILSSLTTIVYVPLLLYFIGTNEFGVYQLICTVMAYLISADFGLCATTRFYTIAKIQNKEQEQKSVLGMAFIYYSILSIFFCTIGYIAYKYIHDIFALTLTTPEINAVKNIYLLLLINIAITFPSSVWTSVITSHEKFIFLRLLQIGQSILRPITICTFVFFFPYAITIAIVQTIYNILYSYIRAWYCYKKLHVRISFSNITILPIKEFAFLASSTLFTFLLEQVLWRSNQFILGISHGIEDVTIYTVASVIYLAYVPFSTAIPSVFFPKITSHIAKECTSTQLSNLFIRIGRVQWMLLLLILMGFIFVGQEFIALWAGREFYEVYYIALIIMIPFSIELMQSIGVSIMQAQNKFSYRVYVYLSMVICNISLAIPLSALYGSIGCAITTAIVMTVGNGFIMNYYYWKKIHLNIFRFWKEMAIIFFISSPVIPLAMHLNDIWPSYTTTTLFFKIIIITTTFILCHSTFLLAKYLHSK